MKYTFQHFVDVKTSADSLTMIQIQAGGQYAMTRIKHLIGAYKYVKLGRVSIKLLPASTLPVDPLGLSYDDDDPQTVDPRDQMNPGLVRITNGEDILTDFTGMSDDAQQQMYINTMLDPRWSKFMLQSGFKRSAVPLYWNVGQLHQDPFPGSVVNLPSRSGNTSDVGAGMTTLQVHSHIVNGDTSFYANGCGQGFFDPQYSDPRGLFQTGHRGRMSWMPTDAFYKLYKVSGDSVVEDHQPMVVPLPEVNVITCLFPKAYKTIYYYRMFITETVYLSGLKNTGINNATGAEFRAIDNFVRVPYPIPTDPNASVSISDAYASKNDGGGDTRS